MYRMTLKKTALSLVLAVLIAACAACKQTNYIPVDVPPSQAEQSTAEKVNGLVSGILSLKEKMDARSATVADDRFLHWVADTYGSDALSSVADSLESGRYTAEVWHTATGNTINVLYDIYTGAADKNSAGYRPDIKFMTASSDSTVIRVTGDISFADNWYIAKALDSRGNGLSGVMSDSVLDLLKSSDITLVNNEFTYSTRGKALSGKAFTFRADPSRVELMKEFGADIVSLANNHAYDFGPEAFSDTLDTLQKADLPYIGGGADISEAKKPFYFVVNGRKFAFTAATRAEKNVKTPQATDETSGVMWTYEPEEYCEVIKQAEEECDFNIAYVHWGAEGSHRIEEGLYEMGAAFIDSGADIVIGAHAHLLQGIEFYGDVPIIYNLGNFLFNAKTMDTGILELTVASDGTPSYRFIPGIQKDCFVDTVSGAERDRVLEFMRSLSKGVSIDADGVITKSAS